MVVETKFDVNRISISKAIKKAYIHIAFFSSFPFVPFVAQSNTSSNNVYVYKLYKIHSKMNGRMTRMADITDK